MKMYIISLFAFFIVLEGSQAQTLKVMSYNIHVGQDASNRDQLQNIADFIKSSNVDIVGLQEVDSVCNRSGKVDQMKFLAENTGMYYAYARHFAFDGGSYGIGILSKCPIKNTIDHRIILTSDGKADGATRALLTATLFSGKKEIMFATVHMDYRDSNSRFAQSQELVRLLEKITLPVILTGDFNAEPGTKEISNLQSILTDTGINSDFSYPALKPRKKIDFVMVSKGSLVRVKRVEVTPVLYSDHLPVTSVFKIRKE